MERLYGSVWQRMLILLLFTLALFGCDGDDGNGGGGPPVSTATLNAFTTAMEDVQTAMTQAMGQVQAPATAQARATNAQTRQGSIEMTFACQTDGEFSLTMQSDSDVSTFSFNSTMAFNNCDGINGTLTFSGNGSFSEENFTYNTFMNGDISTPTCSLVFDGLEQIISFSSSQDYAFTIDGSIHGSCGEESFTCDFDAVNITGTSAGKEVYADSCYQN